MGLFSAGIEKFINGFLNALFCIYFTANDICKFGLVNIGDLIQRDSYSISLEKISKNLLT